MTHYLRIFDCIGMKLTALLLTLIGATLSYHQRSPPSIDWQSSLLANAVVVDLERLLRHPTADRYDSQDAVVVDDEEDGHDILSIDQRAVGELEQRFRSSNSFPSLQQYHHNENVNQFYNQYPPIIPTKMMRDRERAPYYNTQKRNRRPYRPVESSPRFLLSNMFFPSMFYSYLSSFSSSSTTTTYLILNSTLTTTVVTSCVPIAQFTTFPAGVTLTNACRRRRDTAAALDQILIGNDDPNYLDQPFSNFFSEDSMTVDHLGYPVDHQTEIESSQQELDSSLSMHLPSFMRNARSARYTITSTFTSFSFSTVNSTRTVTLASSSVLSCMPYGFKVC